MKQQLKRVKAAVEIAADGLYDAGRFFRWSQSGRQTLNFAQLEGRILAKAHSIEKGLAMPLVRPFFGGDALAELCARMDQYEAGGFDRTGVAYQKGQHAIAAYLAHHEGQTLPQDLAFVRARAAAGLRPEIGGVLEVRSDQIRRAATGDFASLVHSRHSIRDFGPEPVDRVLIDQAVELAQRSPSVCNRQGGRVHVVTEPELLQKALAIQGGNRGFGHGIRTVLVVTNDLSIFRDSKERNQGFVDGGLFAMTLMYGLHFLGLGCCALNWSASRDKDRRFRALLGIPDNQIVIMLLGVGALKDSFRVASSPRRSLATILDSSNTHGEAQEGAGP